MKKYGNYFRLFCLLMGCWAIVGCVYMFDNIGESEDDTPNSLMVMNKSNADICVCAATDKSAAHVSDTLLPAALSGDSQFVSDLQKSSILSRQKGWTSPMVYYGNGYVESLPSGNILQCFVIHSDTLKRYGYEGVRNGNRVLVRYDLTEDDLLRLPYLSFPPDESMKDVKMYPAYTSFHRYH